MNTKVYKRVHAIAIELLKAAEKDDADKFTTYYSELQALCEDNEADDTKNHPVQWETLADFSEDLDVATALYLKALACAETIEASDYLASVNYALATIYHQGEQLEPALQHALQANKHAKDIVDGELRTEIKALLKSMR